MTAQVSNRFQEAAASLPSAATFANIFIASGKTDRSADVLYNISQRLTEVLSGATHFEARRIEIDAKEVGLSALNSAECREVTSALKHTGYKVEGRTELGPDGQSVILIRW